MSIMFGRIRGQFHLPVSSFNLTPVIDIVFLLIVFFLVVCRFIGAENYPVRVPDRCHFAQQAASTARAVTVSVTKTNSGETIFAVGAEQINAANQTALVEALAAALDHRLKELPAEKREVILRIDRDISFDRAKYALAAASVSKASSLRLATFKEARE